mmetsp:Transcript_17661/g.17630  ORF Transcript_17661/g.17630 Transcript_17661/m.17630 type:complete len:768 (+) Transcript_17661:181-2484(+)|eukprot:CAMPEP_0202944870 /NCGR_PEP_ID=MMETSP1395-20130829/5772_1 /ASSEMBLY_ACC=CAM_ASM_000871 /TAXON_ID=5961 /ORGANISM="Blepharisma japonicum, Strain Stock R1072" /LENGTH=767 /DNA_ID=CAMNT_0049644191 /DNA_START=162 /DNA_END=2465 /DNA_ORIENTATION=+
MINTLYQEKSGQFMKKKAALSFQAIVEGKGMKKVGNLELNIADYHINPLNEQVFSVAGCPDKNSRVCISVRAQPLGEAVLADNMSEASGVSGISMGTEGDYNGQLFNEQDLTGFEEEAHQQRVVPGVNGKPPMLKPILRLPESGPMNPMRIAEAMESQRIKLEEDSSSSKLSDFRAQNALLERENQQLKTDKEELKVELGIQYEKFKKDRENLLEHIKKVDTEREEFRKREEKIKIKLTKSEDKLLKMKSINENLLQDLKDAELNSSQNSGDTERLRNEIQKLKENVGFLQEKVKGLENQIEEMGRENANLKNSLSYSQEQNNQLKTTIDRTRQEFSDSREQLVGNAPEDSSFAAYKKKTDLMINNYKREITLHEQEKEEALSRQTELMLELQKAKSDVAMIEDKYKYRLKELETENNEIKEENNNLNQKLDEESQSKRLLERQTMTVKGDAESKLIRLNKQYQELKAQKEQLEVQLAESERTHKQSQMDTGSYNIQKLQEKISSQEKSLNRLKQELKEKDLELEDIYSHKETLEKDNFTLREQLKIATTTEFSDPANLILQDQIHDLEQKLLTSESAHKEDKISSSRQISMLEKQLEILENKKRDITAEYEEKLSKLAIENQILRQNSSESKKSQPEVKSTSQLAASVQEENLKQELRILELEVAESKSKNEQLQGDFKQMEKKYVDAKMGWANSDLEKESLIQKYRDAQEQLRDYSSQFTMMEVELYKINERFGQTLNNNNELEMEIQALRQQMEEGDKSKKKKH